MTRPVLISLRGTQAYGREAPETIELLTRGTLTGRNGKFALSYEETELTGNQGVTTTFLILNPGRVVLNRTGALQSKMVFVEGVKDESFYDLGFGSLLIGVYAHQIQVDLTENGGRLFIEHGMGIVIGETAEIGDDCTIYHGVTLGGTGHDTGKRHPTIGNNVLISTGAKVLGPFKVGDNSRIGANAVVLQEVPPDSTVAGIKARVVKINGQRVGPSPSYALDQIHLPDPVSQELCQLQHRVYVNEQKLKREEQRDREADE